ncbi:MAG: SGNH/GDSL hydrolase family protein [Gemmataceae bacterium]|nr:SGNH/GDSL hydrolase family protein [Gemmataceae bacterium]
MGHVVLLGDSIFDNARYVPGRAPVVEQTRHALPVGWTASLVAVDGATVEDIARQLQRVPADATHLVTSIGGNDALGAGALLRQPAATVGDGLEQLAETVAGFRDEYRAMLRDVLALDKPLVVCTVYDAVPGLPPAERVGLAGFNDVILRAAIAEGLPVIDLRAVCTGAADYSPLSPIEPSSVGGAKIADAIARVVTGHDFAARRTTVYA